MQYLVEDSSITYKIVKKDDSTNVDLSLLFDVGGASDACYIESVQLSSNTLAMMVSVLKDFCETFEESVIVFSIDSNMSDAGALAMRCALTQAGFRTLSGVVDDPDGALFMYENYTAYAVREKLIDETLSFVLDEMVRANDGSRLNLMLSRLGKANAEKLGEAISKFMAADKSAEPSRMVLL